MQPSRTSLGSRMSFPLDLNAPLNILAGHFMFLSKFLLFPTYRFYNNMSNTTQLLHLTYLFSIIRIFVELKLPINCQNGSQNFNPYIALSMFFYRCHLSSCLPLKVRRQRMILTPPQVILHVIATYNSLPAFLLSGSRINIIIVLRAKKMPFMQLSEQLPYTVGDFYFQILYEENIITIFISSSLH